MTAKDKNRLLKLLQEARMTEENSILIYTRHLESAIFWTGVSEDNAVRAKAILKTLADESESHKLMVLSIIEHLNKG